MGTKDTISNETVYRAASVAHAELLRGSMDTEIDLRIRKMMFAFPETVGRDIKDAREFAVLLPVLFENGKWMDTGPSFRLLVGDILDFGINNTPLMFSGISKEAKLAIMGSIREFTLAGVSHADGITETAIGYLHRTFGLASSELRTDIFSHIFIRASNHYTEMRRQGDARGSGGTAESARTAKKTLIEQADRVLAADPEPSVRVGVYRALSRSNFIEA